MIKKLSSLEIMVKIYSNQDEQIYLIIYFFMKRFFLFLFFEFSSTNLFAEYRLEPVNCTIKKK